MMKRILYIGLLLLVMLFAGQADSVARVCEHACSARSEQSDESPVRFLSQEHRHDAAILPETWTFSRILQSRTQRGAQAEPVQTLSAVLRELSLRQTLLSTITGRWGMTTKRIGASCRWAKDYYVILLRRIRC